MSYRHGEGTRASRRSLRGPKRWPSLKLVSVIVAMSCSCDWPWRDGFGFAPAIITVAAQSTTTTTRSLRGAPGLPSNGIKQGSIAIGVLPDWSHEGPIEINAALGAGVSIIGDYINLSPSDFQLRQVEYHLPEVKRVVGGQVKAVYAPALLYGANLNTWTDAMTAQIASTMKSINEQGVVVWLRLLFEMNGGWMPYGLQPDQYRQIWIDVTNAVRAATNETYMLWSPNIWSGSVSDSTQGYVPYFPGESYVDIAGLSYYSLGFDKSVNQAPSTNMFQDNFQSFYDLLTPANGSTGSKNLLNLSAPIPIVISETSAPFYYELPSTDPYYNQEGDTDIAGPLPTLNGTYNPSLATPPYPRSNDELYIKATWFVQLTSNVTAQRFPNLQAVNLFNYLKRGGEGTEVLVDFRAVSGNKTVEAWFRNVIGNQTAYEVGYTGAAPGSSGGLEALLKVILVTGLASLALA